MTTTVQTSVLHGARDLRLSTRALPALSPTDVQIAIKATGLCGSDLHYFTHFRNGDILVREPLTLGHESAGVVMAVGADVPSLAVGDRVALEVGQPCEACELCRQGRYNICREMKFRSSAKAFPHAQGTLQEVVVHPARWCHKLPEGVSLELGALVEPLAVALHASDRARMPDGATVLVFGAGAVGLLCAAVSKVVSKARVVIADIQEDRVRFAVENGFADAAAVVPMRRPETTAEKLEFAKEVAELVKTARVGDGPVGEVTGTYECTGVESCLQASIYVTAPGGRIMIIGMGNPVQTLPISAASLREVDLVGVFRYANTYSRVIELMASGDPLLPDLTKLITQRFSGMEGIRSAFDMAARVKDDEGKLVLKVMVDM
ncbi:chaperonin 10-like protein [Lasiosphaeris hirsuta]|uniref:Chaperonin 10-like protein n=1 Tax=Lasiosphaeris hirsuta TaxID=260670 RepID=A0AA40E2N8_9PEZI|nr:chaperonin 10-like protein [Lasiosphaeris hirsuta]